MCLKSPFHFSFVDYIYCNIKNNGCIQFNLIEADKQLYFFVKHNKNLLNMKNLLTFLFLFSASTTFSQIQKGTLVIGGGLNLNGESDKSLDQGGMTEVPLEEVLAFLAAIRNSKTVLQHLAFF